jgi:threonine/homoserine/homoserine lactone efflux protein
MNFETFLFGIGALLLAPGPTNTLMGLQGARRGLGGVLGLLPAEVAGYLTAILPLIWLGQGALSAWPLAAILLKLAAAVWVFLLALRLWDFGGTGGAAEITARRIYVTTVLNPKALIFGLVFLPAPADPAFGLRLAVFIGLVTVAAVIWGASGSALRTGLGTGRMLVVQRVASVWLAVVAVMLVAGAVSA